jgi:hypothetical protein
MDAGGDSLPPTSGFVAACPKLTELTIICPHPDTPVAAETEYLGPAGSVRSATSELVNACKALPDFDTLQIAHVCGLTFCATGPSVRQGRRELKEHVGCAKDSAISCLRELETGCQEREGRRKITVRAIELVAGSTYPAFLDSVRVGEYEV